MSYRRDREDFIARMAQEGMPLATARLILRDAQTVQRIAVAECCRPLFPGEAERSEQAEARIARRAAEYGCTALLSGDPRGYTTKLLLPSGDYNTWGGAECGWGVPARG